MLFLFAFAGTFIITYGAKKSKLPRFLERFCQFSAVPVSPSVFLPVPTGRSIPRARRIAQKAGCLCQSIRLFFMLYGFSGDGYCLSFSNRGYHGSSVFVG